MHTRPLSREAFKRTTNVDQETGTVIDSAQECVALAQQLAGEGHSVRAIHIDPQYGLPYIELEPSMRLAVMAHSGNACFNAFGRDALGEFRRGTFTRGRVRVAWTDRRI